MLDYSIPINDFNKLPLMAPKQKVMVTAFDLHGKPKDTIDLTKHSKIWINADGEIPNKIMQRFILQRKARPADNITLFVNQACINHSPLKIKDLKMAGFKVIAVENALLTNSKDHPYLVKLAKSILEKSLETKAVSDYVFFSDIFRMMRIVQEEGLYSDTDVLFSPTKAKQITTPFLLGCHQYYDSDADTNIFGMAESMMPDFYEKLVDALKETALQTYIGSTLLDDINKDNVHCFLKIPGILYFPEDTLKDEIKHTIKCFPELDDKITYQYEDHSFTSSENKENLYAEKNTDNLCEFFAKKLNLSIG